MPSQFQEPSVSWALFVTSGRISRATYLLGQLFMLTVLAIVVVLIVNTPETSPRFGFWGLVFIVVGTVAAWSVIALSIKRLHDIGWPSQLIIGLFVPIANLVLMLILASRLGSPETNQHGPPPFGNEQKFGKN